MKKIAFISLLPLLITGCYYDNAEELYQNYPKENCDVSAVSFSQDVEPLIQNNCAFGGCHLNPGAQAGLDLSNYANIEAAKDQIKDRINRPEGDPSRMPPTGTLSACDIEKITTWINQGALNN